ncbi:hypothetical protein F3Y22_tig00000916pilonHSYRG00392 [Hibiscus syriacus]|uniref:Response regulatory domain-containing protein n=1 Tax=Hibiscus syriacus TaxID=106335 RepID=A0A6A3D3G1_HIBSY|nr:hypothetical protein F3Y22_tig00000916pilonHSYRG00392 [Hibiscus syriacus]
MLRGFRYQVTSVKNPLAALSVLRANPDNIDLVVTDLHMPEMNGIELQKQIKREFRKLPVIIMSSDDSERVMLDSLVGGAVFFIVKPVSPDVSRMYGSMPLLARKVNPWLSRNRRRLFVIVGRKLCIGNMRRLSSPVNNERDDGQRAEAVPKKILEHMNVRGLTRENVASHLQKYRLFLKRIAERGCFQSKAMFDRFLKSTFAAGHPLLMKTAQEYARLQELQRLRGLTSYPGYGGNYSPHNTTRYGTFGYGNHGASSSNRVQPYGGGQSRLLSHQANKPLLSGNLMNPTYLGNRPGLSGGLMNSSNSLPSYPQQIQPRSGFYDAGSSSQFRFGSPGLRSPSSTFGTNGIFGSMSGSQSCSSLNPDYDGNNTSYAGSSLNADELNGGYDSMTGVFNENMNVASMGNQTFDYLAPGVLSSPVLHETNQVPPGSTASKQQANTMLPGLDYPGVTDYNSDELLNNGFDLQLDDAYLNELSDLILGSKKYQSSNQQQAGSGSGGGDDNPEFSFGSLYPEIYPSLDELLNSDIDESLEDNAPWNEQGIQSALEELINTDTAAAAGDANPSNESGNTNQAKFNFQN